MSILVIDSWALIEWTLNQPSADAVEAVLVNGSGGIDELVMSWVNVGEAFYMIARKRNPRAAEAFMQHLPLLPIELVLPTPECFVRAARIKSASRLSYADAFAVDLALQREAAVVTGDPEISLLGL